MWHDHADGEEVAQGPDDGNGKGSEKANAERMVAVVDHGLVDRGFLDGTFLQLLHRQVEHR